MLAGRQQHGTATVQLNRGRPRRGSRPPSSVITAFAASGRYYALPAFHAASHRWCRRPLFTEIQIPRDEASRNLGENVVAVACPFQQFASTVLRNITGPALDSVEGDHPKSTRILPGEEIAEDRLPVGFRDAGLDEGAADHKIHGDIIDALRNEFGIGGPVIYGLGVEPPWLTGLGSPPSWHEEQSMRMPMHPKRHHGD
jgi:hypothetical protein